MLISIRNLFKFCPNSGPSHWKQVLIISEHTCQMKFFQKLTDLSKEWNIVNTHNCGLIVPFGLKLAFFKILHLVKMFPIKISGTILILSLFAIFVYTGWPTSLSVEDISNYYSFTRLHVILSSERSLVFWNIYKNMYCSIFKNK